MNDDHESYRLYTLDEAGRFVGVIAFEAPSDAVAGRIAEARRGPAALELWNLARFVRRLEPIETIQRAG